MPELSFMLTGQDTTGAAEALITALDGGNGVKATTTAVMDLPVTGRKVIDPIALVALIVSLPGAVLAVSDIVDRIRKRRKAQAVIEAAQRLRSRQAVEIYLLAADQIRHTVADLDPDRLLDLVATLELPPP